MTEEKPRPDHAARRRISRRSFVKGAAVGGVGVWAATQLPRRAFVDDPHRPPKLYEYFLDNFWFDSVDLYAQRINAPMKGDQKADIAILGGGFAGMSTAYNLIQRFPEKRIVLLEGACCGYGASGRNGGFADIGMPGLHTIYDDYGPETARGYYDATVVGLQQIRGFIESHRIDCDFEENGVLELATEESQLSALEAKRRRHRAMGIELELLDADALRQVIASERFEGGLRVPGHAILNPAKLARGMKRVIEKLGVEVFERSKVMRVEPGTAVNIRTEFAELTASTVVITLNGYAPQLGLFANRLVPLTNYVAATEPLDQRQWASIGWAGREGLSDRRVQFMYLRPTADGRIVFGGEMSPYFYDSAPSTGNYQPALDNLQHSLLTTFPQLEGVRFTHGWGGTMGFTQDFLPAIGALDHAKNVFYAVGFNGEGVVMTQLAGKIVAQLIAGEDTPLTQLPIVGRKPPYVGPEPLRYLGVKLTEYALRVAKDNPVR